MRKKPSPELQALGKLMDALLDSIMKQEYAALEEFKKYKEHTKEDSERREKVALYSRTDTNLFVSPPKTPFFTKEAMAELTTKAKHPELVAAFYANQPPLFVDMLYDKALFKLQSLVSKKDYHPDLNQHLDALLIEVKRLRTTDDKSTVKLTIALKQTYALLIGTFDAKAYKETANTMKGHASPGMAILGGLMLALDLALVGLLAISGVGVTAVGIIGLTYLTGFAIGFFASSMRTGLSKEMYAIANTKEMAPAYDNPIITNNFSYVE